MKILRVLKTGNGVRAYDKSGKPISLTRISLFPDLEKKSTPADSPSETNSEYRAESTAEHRAESNYRYPK